MAGPYAASRHRWRENLGVWSHSFTTDKVLRLITGPRVRPGQKEKKASVPDQRLVHYKSMASASPTMEDQGLLLENALGAVRMHTGAMRRCLDTPGKLMDALKCA